MEEVSALQDIGETGDQGKIHYSVQVVSEGEQGTCRHFSASLRMAVAILAAVAMLVIAVLSYCLILAGELKHSRNTLEEFRTRNEELAKQNGELLAEQEKAARENEELQEKVEILSDTIQWQGTAGKGEGGGDCADIYSKWFPVERKGDLQRDRDRAGGKSDRSVLCVAGKQRGCDGLWNGFVGSRRYEGRICREDRPRQRLCHCV